MLGSALGPDEGILAERRPPYVAGSGGGESSDVVGAVVAAVEGLLERSLDDLDEAALSRELRIVEQVRRRLEARQSRLVAALSSRAADRARAAARTARRAEDAVDRQARRQVQQQVSNDLGWSRTEAKRAADLGRTLTPDGEAGRAFDRGALSPRHAAVLRDTLRWLDDLQVRREMEQELVAVARELDPVAFGRHCRARLDQLHPDGSERAAALRRSRRKATTWQDETGMLGVSARLSGVDAELFQTAFHAFRRPDAPDEGRTSEQAGADALVALARAALDAGTASTDRAVRPHVIVTIDWRRVAAEGGDAPDGLWTGPLPISEVRRLLTDAGVSRLLVDPDGNALEAGEEVRTVPVAVYRGVLARDRVCIGEGCDVPAIYCQVMHLETPYRLGGRLTMATAALGCSYHHDGLDRRGWVVTWRDGRPVLRPPGRAAAGPAPPSSRPARPSDPDERSLDPDGRGSSAVPDRLASGPAPPRRGVGRGSTVPDRLAGGPAPPRTRVGERSAVSDRCGGPEPVQPEHAEGSPRELDRSPVTSRGADTSERAGTGILRLPLEP